MSWDKLTARRSKKAEPEEIDILMAQAFGTPAGEKVLNWLRQRTKETVLAPTAPESALRALEGKRHLVHEMEARISRARKQDVGSYRKQLAKSSTGE